MDGDGYGGRIRFALHEKDDPASPSAGIITHNLAEPRNTTSQVRRGTRTKLKRSMIGAHDRAPPVNRLAFRARFGEIGVTGSRGCGSRTAVWHARGSLRRLSDRIEIS